MKAKAIKLYPDENGVYRMQHFYRDNVQAMFDHMHNMINTYGKEQVAYIIRDLIAAGVFNDDNQEN